MAGNSPYKEPNYPEMEQINQENSNSMAHFDRVAVQIEETFRELIDQLMTRKGYLLRKVLQLNEDFHEKESTRIAALDELEKTQLHFERLSLKVNMNLPIHKEAALVYQKAKHQFSTPTQLPNLSFSCSDFSRLRLRISQFGEVLENLPLMRVPAQKEKFVMQEQREITQTPETEYKPLYRCVTAEEIKRRKQEQRSQKEKEKYSAVPLPTNKDPSNDQRVADKRDFSEKPKFTLKSIFSEFRKDEDISTRTGLPQPEPPQDSGSESSPEPSIGVKKLVSVWDQNTDQKITTVIHHSSSVKDDRDSTLVGHHYENLN